MKILKILGVVLSVAIMFTSSIVHADYTVEIKNEEDVAVKIYTITTNQVAHMQKKANREGESILKQFEYAIISLIRIAKAENAAYWRHANEIYIEEQSRQ